MEKNGFCNKRVSEKQGRNTPISPRLWSKEWANDLLRWFLREILFSDTWRRFPYYKIVIGELLIWDLETHGFPWQAERMRNQINRWKAEQAIDLKVKVSCTAVGGDTPREGGDST